MTSDYQYYCPTMTIFVCRPSRYHKFTTQIYTCLYIERSIIIIYYVYMTNIKIYNKYIIKIFTVSRRRRRRAARHGTNYVRGRGDTRPWYIIYKRILYITGPANTHSLSTGFRARGSALRIKSAAVATDTHTLTCAPRSHKITDIYPTRQRHTNDAAAAATAALLRFYYS